MNLNFSKVRDSVYDYFQTQNSAKTLEIREKSRNRVRNVSCLICVPSINEIHVKENSIQL